MEIRRTAHAEPRLLEDRLREVGPRALTLRGEVPDAEGVAAVDELPRRCGEMADVRGAPVLVRDDRYLVAVGAESEHRAQEVVTRRAEQPRCPHDPGALARRRLAGELRRAVHRERSRTIRLEVGAELRAVEDVVGRERDDRRSDRSGVGRAGDVRRGRAVGIVLGGVDVRPGRAVKDELGGPRKPGRRAPRDVPALTVEGDQVVVCERRRERLPQLTGGAGQEDASASRAERIGVVVLHRCATRGSFHGIPCSSGSEGSYSEVTW